MADDGVETHMSTMGESSEGNQGCRTFVDRARSYRGK